MTVGMQNTSTTAAGLTKHSFAAGITKLMPNGSAPLFGLTAQLSEVTAIATTHYYWSKTAVFPEMTANGAILAAATTLTVDSTTDLLPSALMINYRTSEIVLLLTVPGATTVTMTRGVGSTAAADIDDNDVFYHVGTAFEEGSVRPTAHSIVPVQISNLTQIFRNTWELTGTAAAVQLEAGDSAPAESKADCAGFHAINIETAAFFGQKSTGTKNGRPFRTMDGLLSVINNPAYYPPSYGGSTNTFTAASTTNWTQLEAMLDPVFDQTTDPKTANTRLMFVGGLSLRVLNNICRVNGQMNLMDGQTNYGLQFKTLTTARGRFNLVEHPLFNTNSNWAKMAVIVDLTTFRLPYLTGRTTKSENFALNGTEVGDSGIDAVGGSLTSELTSEIRNVPANAVIRDLTAAAVG